MRNFASSWLIYLNCMMMHGLAKFKIIFDVHLFEVCPLI